jgi:pimeloyl-ACP methyl ester carboxylesterase
MGVAILVCGGCASVENAVVYQPQAGRQPYEAPPPPLEDVMLPCGEGTHVHARWAPRPAASQVILFCHGNGGSIETWDGAFREIAQQLDASVLIFDYPGYGHSRGAPSEAGCYAAAEAAYRWLIDVQKVPPQRIILWGESLGGAVAVELASRVPHRALVVVRSFTSLPEVADDQFPVLVSAPFLTNRYDSLSRIGQCKAPVFVASAEKDRLMPLRHGKRLYAACTSPAEFCLLRGLEHNDPLPPGFYSAVRNFLASKAPAATQ